MAAVAPFSIAVDAAVLADLGQRLARVRWPDEIHGSEWRFGASLPYLRSLVDHWRDGYDWRRHEAALNTLPQFMTRIRDVPVHFIHVPGAGPDPAPLLVMHGWPSSVWELQKLIPRLVDPASFGADPKDSFTVIAPSLPGHGFSFTPGQPRLGIAEIADVYADLMIHTVGHERFFTAGGDWGAFISARLGHVCPEHLLGIHLSLLPLPRDAIRPERPTPDERRYFEELDHFLREETGYSWIQGTKPQTLAYALTDSPVGLAAWIVEKFQRWSDCGGDIESIFSKDDLLTNVMIYWVTGAINSSFWPYYARHHEPWPFPPDERITVPTAHAAFPRDIVRQPRAWAERAFDLRRWTDMPVGGHFAAFEQPDLLAADLREFFRTLRPGRRPTG